MEEEVKIWNDGTAGMDSVRDINNRNRRLAIKRLAELKKRAKKMKRETVWIDGVRIDKYK